MSKKWTQPEIDAVFLDLKPLSLVRAYSADIDSYECRVYELIYMVLAARAEAQELREDLKGAADYAEACKCGMQQAQRERHAWHAAFLEDGRKTRDALDKAIAECDVARAEVEMLRGVGCCEDGDGPCGVCIKCARRDRDSRLP